MGKIDKRFFIFGVPGFVVQSIGICIHPLLALLGSVLLIIGLAYYSKAKGYPVCVAVLGLLGLLGVIILFILKNRHKNA